AKWTNGMLVISFEIKKAAGLFCKSIEGVIHGKVGFVAWKPRPLNLRCPICFVLSCGIYLCHRRGDQCPQFFLFFDFICPCQYVNMCLYRQTMLTDCFI